MGRPDPAYRVTTWDEEADAFTPQPGVKAGLYSKWGLRRALRKLREAGYDTNRKYGHCVFIERVQAED